jgi:hypothetical protein
MWLRRKFSAHDGRMNDFGAGRLAANHSDLVNSPARAGNGEQLI